MNTAFLIAAPCSGSGKTTVARGLMALLVSKGYRVQPFKCGPDYIDTKFHEAVCGRPSVNLDTFMASPYHVRRLFHRYGDDADVCVVEGMMGLYDGYDRDGGSSAEIARVLDIPVVLVVDARSAAYSTAALLSGFIGFRSPGREAADSLPPLRFSGVIFNKVGSPRHAAMLRQVCRDVGIPCLGCLPRDAALEQASRYLGLDFSRLPAHQHLVSLLEAHLDPNAFPLSRNHDRSPDPAFAGSQDPVPMIPGHTLVARSPESFSFVYQEVLDSLGGVRFFNPEEEVPDFTGVSLLYLPGGYPEKHLDALVANGPARRAVRDFALQGGRVVAECGGMMYLCREIVTDEGAYPMCGVLPYTISARKADRRLSLGYRRFTLDGREYRGHEFHYTQFLGSVPPSAAQVFDARGEAVPTPVFRLRNVLASYTHLYQI